ncbi:hypothetical protein LMG24076_03446 [Trinickia soli]|nr:hypothetical protein LMG24076_03446 [Trinickia soli]
MIDKGCDLCRVTYAVVSRVAPAGPLFKPVGVTVFTRLTHRQRMHKEI